MSQRTKPLTRSTTTIRYAVTHIGAADAIRSVDTAGVDHAPRRRGWGVAARSAGAAGRADAAHRRTDEYDGQYRAAAKPGGVPAGAAATGLDRKPQRADGCEVGRRRCSGNSQTR